MIIYKYNHTYNTYNTALHKIKNVQNFEKAMVLM